MGLALLLPVDRQGGTEGPSKLAIGEGDIRLVTLSLVIAFTISGAAGGSAAVDTPLRRAPGTDEARVSAPESCSARKGVRFYAERVAYWESKLGAPKRAAALMRTRGKCPRYLAHVLQRKAYALSKAYARYLERRRAYFHRLYEKWRCIHEHEGAWNSNTGNGYWGGLQMDWGFMHTYGPEFIRRYGLAHRWPVWAQLVAAERAYHGFAGFKGRGYSPWGTAPMCGLG